MSDQYLIVDNSTYPHLYFQARGLTFRGARLKCSSHYGGKLAVVKDASILERIAEMIPTKHAQFYRIGLSRKRQSKDFTWVDGTPFHTTGLLQLPQMLENNPCLGMTIYKDSDDKVKLREATCFRELAYICAVSHRSSELGATKFPNLYATTTTTTPFVGTKLVAILAASLVIALLIILALLVAIYARRKKYASIKVLQLPKQERPSTRSDISTITCMHQLPEVLPTSTVNYSTGCSRYEECDPVCLTSFTKTYETPIYETIDGRIKSRDLESHQSLHLGNDAAATYSLAQDVPPVPVVYSVVNKASKLPSNAWKQVVATG